MIRADRGTEPTVLSSKKAAWDNAVAEARTKQAKKAAFAKVRHQQIRTALEEAFHGKCAYCESKIKHVSYTQIEHYRPVSKRQDLAFCWDNLLLACGRCNGAEFKGDQFPEADADGPLLDPCSDDPTDHLDFVFDPVAGLTTVAPRTLRGQVTVRTLGLNRPDLRTYRSSCIGKLAVLAMLASEHADCAALLAEAQRGDAEYSAFARALSASTEGPPGTAAD
ncbi:MAG: TIGR02646 family protein [Armatimonadetes bacterium]|nr:TIGR02646 family protein [Armatimonadota bacterium]